MTFRPLLWPTVTALPALIVLLALGFWQLERLAWKADLIAQRQAALAAPPVELPGLVVQPEKLNFSRVRASGHFLHERELHVLNRNREGVAGVHVVTPFKRIATEGGGVVLVDRGWVPNARRAPETRMAGQIAGEIRLSGIVRTGTPGRGWLTPADDPAKGVWYAADAAAMARSLGLTAPDFIIEISKMDIPGELPIGGRTRTEIVNNHFSYALTWFALAGALTAIYLIFALRVRRSS